MLAQTCRVFRNSHYAGKFYGSQQHFLLPFFLPSCFLSPDDHGSKLKLFSEPRHSQSSTRGNLREPATNYEPIKRHVKSSQNPLPAFLWTRVLSIYTTRGCSRRAVSMACTPNFVLLCICSFSAEPTASERFSNGSRASRQLRLSGLGPLYYLPTFFAFVHCADFQDAQSG